MIMTERRALVSNIRSELKYSNADDVGVVTEDPLLFPFKFRKEDLIKDF